MCRKARIQQLFEVLQGHSLLGLEGLPGPLYLFSMGSCVSSSPGTPATPHAFWAKFKVAGVRDVGMSEAEGWAHGKVPVPYRTGQLSVHALLVSFFHELVISQRKRSNSSPSLSIFQVQAPCTLLSPLSMISIFSHFRTPARNLSSGAFIGKAQENCVLSLLAKRGRTMKGSYSGRDGSLSNPHPHPPKPRLASPGLCSFAVKLPCFGQQWPTQEGESED